jgi:hypothetical protein
MVLVGIFYDHWEYFIEIERIFKAIWYIFGLLVYFSVLVCLTKKNLATLTLDAIAETILSEQKCCNISHFPPCILFSAGAKPLKTLPTSKY